MLFLSNCHSSNRKWQRRNVAIKIIYLFITISTFKRIYAKSSHFPDTLKYCVYCLETKVSNSEILKKETKFIFKVSLAPAQI